MKNRTAIVTGASRGIGMAIALKLGEMGASVAVNYARDARAAESVCKQITDMGSQAAALRADMRNPREITALFDQTIERFGSVNILVNNAGMALFKKIEDFTEDEFDDIFALNVKGVFFACQEAAKKMADGGKIINIASSVTKMMLPTYGAYAATKGAVEQITKVLAKELGHRKISVNAISPGPVDTALFREGKTEAQIRNLADMAAFGRIGTPGDIAGAVALLVNEQANWVSGQNLCVNGGLVG